jgi:hypothetical protein
VAALGTTPDALNLELGYNVAGNNEDLAVYFQEQWRTVFGIEVKPDFDGRLPGRTSIA